MANKSAASSFEEYSMQFPPETRKVLAELRALIQATAPGATEKISYAMPAFFLNGNLVWFGAYAHHIGFYPGSTAIEVFREDIRRYKSAKGSVQFPLDEPMPWDLIRRIVEYRVKENTTTIRTKSRGPAGKRGAKSTPA